MNVEPCITEQLPSIKSGSGSSSSSETTGLKMKAFSLSSSRKPMSKLEIEKQKKLEADAEAAKAYEEFVATFEQDGNAMKPISFVKGSVINPGIGGTSSLLSFILKSAKFSVFQHLLPE